MPISPTLLEIDELHQFLDDNTFTQNITVEWIESVLTLSEHGVAVPKTARHWRLERYPEDTWEDLQVFALDDAIL